MSPARPNRLSQCTSPYLLQHAHNPVDWYPWSPEALGRAKAEDKPIFLSVGYSACHWCHVMEEESFENPRVAEALNRHFIPIKVDREERPDLDDLYMGAVHALAGRGGWPMSVWLTPALQPFYGGTYFPPESRSGQPGFLDLLTRIAQVWQEDRAAVQEDAHRLTEALRQQDRIDPSSALPEDHVIEDALQQLRRSFDPHWGGFGRAPKFPSPQALELIMWCGRPDDQAMVTRTLDAMADGGIFDHLGGGFARYSVDAKWLIPHFEKMLYDNAQLAAVYASAYALTGRARYADVTRATLDYLLRDMQDPAGGFYSSEDADSEGEEGRYYVFTPAQVTEILGAADGAAFCEAYGISVRGNFEGGRSVLHRPRGPVVLQDESRMSLLSRSVWEARERRVHPLKDDKVLASWNGLALSALARGYQVLKDRRYLDAATTCATFLQRELFRDGQLLRTWRRGKAHTAAFLEDYAAVANGLVDVYEASFDPQWLQWAEQLAASMTEQFEDPDGGFFGTSTGHADVLLRQRPVHDQAQPSANALAVRALLRLGHHFERRAFLASAERALVRFASPMSRYPSACLGLLQSLEIARNGPTEIVVGGAEGDPRVQAFIERAWRVFPDRRLLARVRDGSPALTHPTRRTPHANPMALVCRNRACSAPLETMEALEAALA